MQDKFRRNIKYKKIFSREFTGGFFIFVLFKMEPLQPFSQIICIGKKRQDIKDWKEWERTGENN